MDVLNFLGKFQREQDGLSLLLTLKEWPVDVPLPVNISLLATGDNYEHPIQPKWRVVFEPECTYEVVAGIFTTPLPITDVIRWYEIELKKLNWIQNTERHYSEEQKAKLRFWRPLANAHLKISLRRRTVLNDTELMIRRVIQHPYSLAVKTPSDDQLILPLESIK